MLICKFRQLSLLAADGSVQRQVASWKKWRQKLSLTYLRSSRHTRPRCQVATRDLMQVYRRAPAWAVHALVPEGPQRALHATLVALWDLGAVKAQGTHHLACQEQQWNARQMNATVVECDQKSGHAL